MRSQRTALTPISGKYEHENTSDGASEWEYLMQPDTPLSDGLLCLQAFAPGLVHPGLVQVPWAAKRVDKAQDSAQHLCHPQDPRLQPSTHEFKLTARCVPANNCTRPDACVLSSQADGHA